MLEKDGCVFLFVMEIFRLLQLKCIKKNDLSPLTVTERFEQRNEQHYDLIHYISNKGSVS